MTDERFEQTRHDVSLAIVKILGNAADMGTMCVVADMFCGALGAMVAGSHPEHREKIKADIRAALEASFAMIITSDPSKLH